MAGQRGRPRKTASGLPAIDAEKLLSAEEQAEIREAARRELLEEQKADAKKAFMEQALEEERRKLIPDEELRSLQIDLPGHSDRIVIDGIVYLHGAVYQFNKAQYDTVHEIMQRAWHHEEEVDGANRDAYRKPRGVRIRPGDENNAPRSLMRV